MKDNFFWLQNWIYEYFSKIQKSQVFRLLHTLDNPGWAIDIHLESTELAGKQFQIVDINVTEDDWFFCRVRDSIFEGRCGPLNLLDMLKIFRSWANHRNNFSVEDSDTHFMWLSKWYFSQCDGDWENVYGIKIETQETPGWLVEVELSETELENQPFQPTKIERSKENWVECCVEKNVFRGKGGSLNLVELVAIFHHWAKAFQTERENSDFEICQSDYDAFIKRKNARLTSKESI